MQKILVIQTAFIGDVVLATALVEKLHVYYQYAQIDFLVRKGNETLLANNPNIKKIWVWNKKEGKIKNLFQLISGIRKIKYDLVINLQRYFSTGLLSGLSGAKQVIGFDKNPLSFLYSKKVKHVMNEKEGRHEVERNNDLIKDITDNSINRPVLYPSVADEAFVSVYITPPFVTMTPSSIWFTKKYPVEKWIDLINEYNQEYKIYLLGSADNLNECKAILNSVINNNVEILAGKLTFLQSAALMRSAFMNYTNDSAPLHFASAVNAPVTAIFCSTIPAFGYTPLSDRSYIVETTLHLKCRPCGLHGHKACPLGHFKCALSITTGQVLKSIYAN
ncbi:MAG: glycosyltransferase family 9 protein [Ferruginibacter sp.]